MATPTLDRMPLWLEKPKSVAAAAVSGLSSTVVDLRDSTQSSLAAAPRQRRWVVIGVVAAALAVVILVLAETVVGALLQARSQQVLAPKFAQTLDVAAGAAGTPDLSPLPIDPPRVGDPVGIVRIPSLGMSQVIVEGQDSAMTQNGPGHVLGTSLPGQPGNAAIVGRRTTFGAPFRNLNRLRKGNRIAVTTVEGTAVYVVDRVGYAHGDLFKPLARNQLTLVTSGPRLVATSDLVATATLQGRPFAPTPQNARTYASPRAGSTVHWAQAVVWIVAMLIAIGGMMLALRRKLLPSIVLWMFAVPVLSALFILILRSVDTFLPATL